MRRLLKRIYRHIALLVCVGGVTLQVNSCNPNVRGTFIQGLQTLSLSLANTLINSAFSGLDGNSGASSLGTLSTFTSGGP